MVLPLVGIAVATAARLAAKKLAKEAVKKTAKSVTSRARSNSVAAAKAVAPKNLGVTASRIKMAKTADARRKYNAATEKRILDNQVKKSVKVLPRNTAPKTDLSGRGAKLTPKEQAQRASDLNFGKMEQRFDRLTEMRSTGLVSSRKGLVAARSAGKNNQRKADAIKKEANKTNIYEATKKPPIKINSQRNLKAR